MTSTKAYDTKTAAFIGFLIQNVPSLSNEQMTEWMENPSALKNLLNGLNQKATSTNLQRLFFFRVRPYKLAEISSKLTQERHGHWAWNSDTFHEQSGKIQEVQPSTPACTITALVPKRKMNAIEVAQAVLGTRETDTYTLGNELIARGHGLTLAQGEKLGYETACEEFTGLVITEVDKLENKGFLVDDNLANFFFLKTGVAENPVMLGRIIGNDENDWSMDIYDFDRTVECGTASHFLIRNLKK